MDNANLNKNRINAKLMCMSAQINDWSDIHFAYQVAKHGTLSAAAEALGVHHSTVLRRIDALEQRLNTRLFHRHARGYTATESGQMLLKVAEQTQEDFDRMLGQLEGADEQLRGTLVITSVSTFTPMLTPIFAGFQQQHPEIRIEYLSDPRLFKLEYGEAHIGIRPGDKPKDPDYVVQHLKTTPAAFYASADYIKRHGRMKSLQDFKGHRFINSVNKMMNIPPLAWMVNHIPEHQIYYRVSEISTFEQAVQAGIGIAPLAEWNLDPSLVRLFEPPQDWVYSLWLITHRDVHRTAKVQAFTQYLKQQL